MKIPFSGDSVRPAAESLFRVSTILNGTSTFDQTFYHANADPVLPAYPVKKNGSAKCW